MLEERAPALFAHLSELSFPVDQTAERWFLSLFTSTYLPLPTVLRIWDVFFAQGVRILFGVGLALFLRAEDMLFRAKSSSEAREILHGTERTSIDADILFSHALKDDLNISCTVSHTVGCCPMVSTTFSL
jgi:TBC1 domain family member 10